MTKIQKIWLGVFASMFIVPEVLWSPVGNVLYSFFQSGKIIPQVFRNNFLLEYRYEFLLKIFILMQLVGILLVLFKIIKYRKNIKNLMFWLLSLIIIPLIILTAFAFYLISIFNPSFP